MNLGLSPNDFWDMTFLNYLRLVIHQAKKEANEWERTRVTLSYILNTQVEKKHQKKPKDILPLWTDNLARLLKANKKVELPSQEDKESMLKQVGKV
jgi:hypothetical protein